MVTTPSCLRNTNYGKTLCFIMVSVIVVSILVQSTFVSIRNRLITNRIQCINCNLSSPLYPTIPTNATSICSTRATQRGPNQKVISISLFGPVENPKMFPMNKSLLFLQQMINEMKEVYADNWILRVYHDEKFLNRTIIDYFEGQYNFVDFCNVTTINMTFIHPRIWRFLSAADELVSVMLSRDLDSPLTPRERAAIDEWLSSKLSVHAMRDHPDHVTAMMAGMWGFRAEYDHKLLYYIRSKLFDRSLMAQYALNTDQQFLSEHIWPLAQSNAMTHDSYHCINQYWNRHHRPFPTQRPTSDVDRYCFIGCPKPCCVGLHAIMHTCPNACRPKQHQDWINC